MKSQGFKVQESYSEAALLVNEDEIYTLIGRMIMYTSACGRVFSSVTVDSGLLDFLSWTWQQACVYHMFYELAFYLGISSW